MKRIFVIFVVLMMAMVASATNTNQNIKWSKVKPILEKAIKTNYRVDLPMDWPFFYPQLPNDMERAEMVKLYLLGQRGSYTGHILPALDQYLFLYDRQIKSAKTNNLRRQYFKKELDGLAYIFITLRYQVRTYQDFPTHSQDEERVSTCRGFRTQYEKCFAILGQAPVSEQDESLCSFLDAYPKIPPGFPSLILTDPDAFQDELQQVQIELKELPAEVSVHYYKLVLKMFPGVLENDQWK